MSSFNVCSCIFCGQVGCSSISNRPENQVISKNEVSGEMGVATSLVPTVAIRTLKDAEASQQYRHEEPAKMDLRITQSLQSQSQNQLMEACLMSPRIHQLIGAPLSSRESFLKQVDLSAEERLPGNVGRLIRTNGEEWARKVNKQLIACQIETLSPGDILYVAIDIGQTELVEFLCAAGSHCPAISGGFQIMHPYTILMKALDNPRMIMALLNAGVSDALIHARNPSGDTAFTLAASISVPEVLQAILDAAGGLDSHELSHALLNAVASNNIANVEFLLKAGAKPNSSIIEFSNNLPRNIRNAIKAKFEKL